MVKGRDNERVILQLYFFQQVRLLGFHRKEKLGYNAYAAIFLLGLEVTSKSTISYLLFISVDQIIGKVSVYSWGNLKQEYADCKHQEFLYLELDHIQGYIIYIGGNFWSLRLVDQ